jgi:uncharacterized protein (DUF2236 family)
VSTVDDAMTPDQLELIRRYTDGIAVFLLGPANVAIQLARRPVGRGVVESPVPSGSIYEHPFKRFRTTVGYLDIAMMGDAGLRADYRRAVNGVHRQVRSGPDSPVAYNALDPDLQLWVASCLYYGYRDSIVRLHGPLTAHEEELLLQASARFATTLQVPADRWHADRPAFEAYWAGGLRDIEVDDETRAYLLGVIEMDILPRPLSTLFGPMLRFFNIGFLPPEVRKAMGLTWTPRQERRMQRILRTVGAASRPLPHTVRRIPANWMTLNIRLRRALGRPLV